MKITKRNVVSVMKSPTLTSKDKIHEYCTSTLAAEIDYSQKCSGRQNVTYFRNMYWEEAYGLVGDRR